MGKSIRSKRKKRLRTIKREIVVPHYDVKELAKMAAQEVALAASKIEIPKRRQESEEIALRGRDGSTVLMPMSIENEIPVHGRDSSTVVMPMSIDNEESKSMKDSKLKPTRVINKRGKSRKRELSTKGKKRKKTGKF